MTLITPKIKSATVKLKTDRPVQKTPYQVKGVLMKNFPNDEIVPMLNGSYRKKFLYPRIQVKIVDEEILLVFHDHTLYIYIYIFIISRICDKLFG